MDAAFFASKDMLSKSLIRHEFDSHAETIVYTDASNQAVCAVLTQNGKLIMCTSKTLNKHQQKWATIEKELLAISWCCRKLRQYLLGHSFRIFTDHKPLEGIFKRVDHIDNQRLLTLVLSTSEFDFDVKYLKGSKNVVADFGSRMIPLHTYPDDWNNDKEFFFLGKM
jgi:hypothetical protein